MRNYAITVNGNVYDVFVEELGIGATVPVIRPSALPKAAPMPMAMPAPMPVAAPAPVPAPEPAAMPVPAANAPAESAQEGGIRVEAGAAGKVCRIVAEVGQTVRAGEEVIIIEAMKMEIPIVAPKGGTVASIHVSVGEAIESGALLATLK